MDLTRITKYTRLQEDNINPHKTIPEIKHGLTNTHDTKFNKNNVIVLADNKNYNRNFLHCLGMSQSSPYLCTIHVPTKMFTFQTYGLEETDIKILNHIKENSGLVIITNIKNYPNILSRIKFYAENINFIPILVVLEYYNDNKQILDITKLNLELISKSNLKYQLFNTLTKPSEYFKSELECQDIDWFNDKVINYKKNKEKEILKLEQLVKQFVDCDLSIENWSHFNRLRLVYFSLKNFGYDKTIDQKEWLCVCWNKYKNTIGHEHLWNYTLTKFWIDKIFALVLENPSMDFSEIYLKYNFLSDGNLHKKYYSNDVLFSDEARKKWIKPNLN